jgi:hypothetical protein
MLIVPRECAWFGRHILDSRYLFHPLCVPQAEAFTASPDLSFCLRLGSGLRRLTSGFHFPWALAPKGQAKVFQAKPNDIEK